MVFSHKDVTCSCGYVHPKRENYVSTWVGGNPFTEQKEGQPESQPPLS